MFRRSLEVAHLDDATRVVRTSSQEVSLPLLRGLRY
jgi:hypothetical protein